MKNKFLIALSALFLLFTPAVFAADETITIGSKMDGESYLLAEIMSQLLESRGYVIERKFGFGGTLICYNALIAGEIDLYPEYTGTISQVILKQDERPADNSSIEAYQDILKSKDLNLFSRFGFNNTYVLAIKRSLAEQRKIEKISDLKLHTDLTSAFSHEFLNRSDGWPALKLTYGLEMSAVGIQHGLSYKAIDLGSIDITDAYSTDGDIKRYELTLLRDDLGFFPKYYGAAFARQDFPVAAMKILSGLENLFDDETMLALNAKVVIDKETFAEVAQDFLKENGLVSGTVSINQNSMFDNLVKNTLTHIKIMLIALSIGVFIGLLGAVMIFRSQKISRYVIYFTGLLQTIPSIALLALMIPILGIGEIPAITALFLYSLLPILRSAVTALTTIDPVLVNVSKAIGMTKYQQLRHVLLPLALPNILSGIKTAAVICIGTATLAAFIGAGGLGEPIVTGLALNDTSLILQGAIPAAILAIIVELLFELLEKKLISEHMRKAA